MDAFRLTMDTGRWIFKTPFVLAVILFGMMFDGILRMVITLASQYYRLVQLPESVFRDPGVGNGGWRGCSFPGWHFVLPNTGRRPSACGPTTATALAGLCGMAFFWPYTGLFPALVAFSALYMVGFYVSYFVNQQASSSRPGHGAQLQGTGLQPGLRFHRACLCRAPGGEKDGYQRPSGLIPKGWRTWFSGRRFSGSP